MIIPKLQQGEWLEGYRGRVARLNDITSRWAVEPALRFHFGLNKDKEAASLPAILAASTDRSLEAIIMENSLWPAQVSVDRPGPRHLGQIASTGASKFVFSRPMRPRIWFCPSCATAERTNPDLGISLWHRSHQIPGEMECTRHGAALQSVERESLMLDMPHEHLRSGKATPHHLGSVARNQSVIRAQSLIRQVASGQVNLSRAKCATVLNRRAVQLGLGGDVGARIGDVKRRVARDFPCDWIQDAMPGMREGLASLAFVNAVLGPSATRISSAAIAVVAAVLFDEMSLFDSLSVTRPITAPLA